MTSRLAAMVSPVMILMLISGAWAQPLDPSRACRHIHSATVRSSKGDAKGLQHRTWNEIAAKLGARRRQERPRTSPRQTTSAFVRPRHFPFRLRDLISMI